MLIEDLRGHRPSAPTAGVLKVLLNPLGCGVSFGVGSGPRRCKAGSIFSLRQVARGVGSSVLGILFGGMGVDSFELGHTASLQSTTGTWSVKVWGEDSFTNSACPKSMLSSAGVRRGMIDFHVSIRLGEALGEETYDADGEYLITISVQR